MHIVLVTWADGSETPYGCFRSEAKADTFAECVRDEFPECNVRTMRVVAPRL